MLHHIEGWWNDRGSPLLFTAFGAALGFVVGRLNVWLDDRRAQKSFIAAIAIELRRVRQLMEKTKGQADETLADHDQGKNAVVHFTGTYPTTVFETQFGKLRDLHDQRILLIVEIYDNISSLQALRETLTPVSMELAQTGSEHNAGAVEAKEEVYFSGLRRLSEMIAETAKHIDTFLKDMPKRRTTAGKGVAQHKG
jgi:hypothetical protein